MLRPPLLSSSDPECNRERARSRSGGRRKIASCQSKSGGGGPSRARARALVRRSLSQAAAACQSVALLLPPLSPVALSSCLFLRSNFSESEFVTKVFLCAAGRTDGRTDAAATDFYQFDICDLSNANTDGVSFGRNNERSRLTVTKIERDIIAFVNIVMGAMSDFYAFRFWHA